MLDGRVKTLHPRVHAGILARRDEPAHLAALEMHAIPDDRPRRRQPVSVPRNGREARLHARRRGREHRHRRADDGARRREELAARRRRRRPSRLRCVARRARGERTRAVGADALRARAQGVLAHGVLRWRDLELAHRARSGWRRGRVSRPLQPAGDQGAGPALRRESAPAGRTLPRRTSRRGHARDVPPVAGQGSLVQQPCRCRCGVGMREDARRRGEDRGLRDRQARESVRRRGCRLAARRVRQGVRDRPGLRIRRHHRVQPARRRVDDRSGGRAVPRGADRTGLHAGCARGDRPEEERPRARGGAAVAHPSSRSST